MKRGSTIFLRGVVILVGMAVLAFYVFALPVFAGNSEGRLPEIWRVLALGGWYATAVPFFFALYQLLKLLGYIDKNNAFSDLSVKALRNMKYSAILGSIFLSFGLPVVYFMADVEDAPGLMLFGLIIAFIPIVIAAFIAVLQRLLKEAIDIKTENDSTI